MDAPFQNFSKSLKSASEFAATEARVPGTLAFAGDLVAEGLLDIAGFLT